MSNLINCRVFGINISKWGFIAMTNTLILIAITPSDSLPGPLRPLKKVTDVGNIVFFGSNLTWEGFLATSNDHVHEFVENLKESGKTVEVIPNAFFHLSDDPDDVRFFLYRDSNNPDESEELLLNDATSVSNSSFAKNETTVLVIHGFLSNSTSGMPTTIKNGFFDGNIINNLIIVDWGKLSTPDPNCPLLYPVAYPVIVKRNIPTVYQRVGEFIQFLVDSGFTSLDNTHVIGHSLGAHVSGGAGGVIAENPINEGRKIGRISGLDPAGPLFQGIQVQRRLTKEDAEFVDMYHTASGTLGTVVHNEAHANFLPNGGHHQPGCRDFGQIFWEAGAGSCSHSFVNLIYAASIQNDFTACRCDPHFVDLIVGNSCPGNCTVSVLAGYPCPSDARGQFYFETGEDPFTGEPDPSASSIHDNETESVSDEGGR